MSTIYEISGEVIARVRRALEAFADAKKTALLGYNPAVSSVWWRSNQDR